MNEIKEHGQKLEKSPSEIEDEITEVQYTATKSHKKSSVMTRAMNEKMAEKSNLN